MTLTCRANSQTEYLREFFDKRRNCDLVWGVSDWEVGPSFSLRVSFHEIPVAGARIELETNEGQTGFTTTTDSLGFARFSAIPPGEYYPGATDGLDFPLGHVIVKVVPNHPSGNKVEIEWPAQSISVRRLRGRLVTSGLLGDPANALLDAKVELLDLRTGLLIDSGRTDVDGWYDFLEGEPGLYALRVTPPTKPLKDEPLSRDIAVELDPEAEEIVIPEMTVINFVCDGPRVFRETPDGWEEQ